MDNFFNNGLKRGFTLIEVLTALIIITLITSVSVVAVNSSKKNARDTRRKEDFNAIASALQLYYQDNQTYPISSSLSISSVNNPWITGLTPTYIPSLAVDPKNNAEDNSFIGNGVEGYAYGYYSYNDVTSGYSAGMWYSLIAKLENKNDSDRIGKTCLKWITGNKLSANDGSCPNDVNSHTWSPDLYVKLNS